MERKNTGINIKPDLHKRAADFAKQGEWRSFSAFAEKAIEEKLEREEKRAGK